MSTVNGVWPRSSVQTEYLRPQSSVGRRCCSRSRPQCGPHPYSTIYHTDWHRLRCKEFAGSGWRPAPRPGRQPSSSIQKQLLCNFGSAALLYLCGNSGGAARSRMGELVCGCCRRRPGHGKVRCFPGHGGGRARGGEVTTSCSAPPKPFQCFEN